MNDNDATRVRQGDATKQLRAMLDERGVKHKDFGKLIYDDASTIWQTHDGAFIFKAKEREGVVRVYTCTAGKSIAMTPAQAIAATVAQDLFIHGPEVNEQTCTVETVYSYSETYHTLRYVVELSCHTIDWDDSEPPQYCPYCGRKVVNE